MKEILSGIYIDVKVYAMIMKLKSEDIDKLPAQLFVNASTKEKLLVVKASEVITEDDLKKYTKLLNMIKLIK
jgi:hypothetical protein